MSNYTSIRGGGLFSFVFTVLFFLGSLQDRERLFVELEHMQQTDLLRRRQQVSQMPPQIFQPLLKRQETREDFQREMEFAFEDMYTGERSKSTSERDSYVVEGGHSGQYSFSNRHCVELCLRICVADWPQIFSGAKHKKPQL